MSADADAVLWCGSNGQYYQGWHDFQGHSCDHHVKGPLAVLIVEAETCLDRGHLRWEIVELVDGMYLRGYAQ